MYPVQFGELQIPEGVFFDPVDGASVPPGVLKMRGIVRDRQGKVFINNDEDMQHIHPDDWLNALSEDDRQYLISKHGEHNKPKGV